MKIRILPALVGFAICLMLPTFGQQKDTVDPKETQQIRTFMTKWDEAFNRSDSGGLGALYTDDAVRVTPHGTFHGRQAIAKDYAERAFWRYQANNYVRKGDRIVAVGNDVRVTGKWSCAFHDTDDRDKHIDGHYSWF
jgi:ketosteroid isomerase-like protein